MRERALLNVLRHPIFMMAALTGFKFAAFVGLSSGGHVTAFVGDNATSHYLPIAERLLTERRFNGPDSRPDSKVPLGYPASLALLKAIGGKDYLILVVCFQMVSDLVVAVLLLVIGIQLGQRRAGVVAGFAWSLFPPAIALSTWITAESLFTCVLLGSLVLLTVALQRRAVCWSLIAGMLLGAATLFRGTCLLLPIGLTPLWLSRSVPRGWFHGLAFAAGTGVVVVPWAVRNVVVLGDPILVSVGFGSAFLQGSHPDVFTIAGKQAHYPQMFQDAETAGVTRPSSDRESEVDSWLMRVGERNYRERLRLEPWSVIPFAGMKCVRLWYGTENGSQRTQLALLTCSLLIVPAGVWQFVRLRCRFPEVSLLYLLTLFYFVALHAISLPEYRYMYPVFPFLIFGAAAAACSLLGKSGAGRPLDHDCQTVSSSPVKEVITSQ